MTVWVVVWVVLGAPLLTQPPTAPRSAFVVSSFCSLVGHVVRLSAEKEMYRVDARRIIAAMQSIQTVRDWADEQLVGSAIGEHHALAPATTADDSVPVFVRAADPRNAAAIGLASDVAKESVNKRNHLPRRLASLRAKPPAAKLDIARAGVERELNPASLTLSGDVECTMTWHSGPPKQVQM